MAKKHKTELDVDPTSAVEEEDAEEKPAEAAEEEEDEGGPKVNKAKRNLIIGIAVGVIVLITALSTALYYVLKEEPKPEIEVVEEKIPEPVKKKPLEYKAVINMKLEPFVIPFEENGEKHFWMIAFSLQLTTKQAFEEIEENIAFVREAIYIFLNTHDRHEFLGRNKKLREQTFFDMRVLIDRSLQSGRVEAIQIIEFTVL